jgi:tetratricopeptide (TPR) repeat protein
MGFLPADEESEWWKERARAIRLETRRPLRRIRIPRETALYGRDDELARLEALYGGVRAGEGRVLLLEGEAGIGKTRLLDEFVGRLQEGGEDLNFLFGSYPPGGAATAAGAFTTAYGEHFGHEGLEEALEGYLTATPALGRAFAALLRGEPTPQGEEALTKDSLQTVFVHVTRGLAAERPTVVLVDDLHFSPEEGQALFTTLAMAVPGHRILLVGTMRPGVQEDWIASTTRLEHCEQLALTRLGPKDLVRLIEESFQSERLAEKLGTKIALKSDGNPFFVFEIIRGLREGRFITQTPDGSWATTQEIDDIQIPSSVMDLIRARTADLDEEERDLLDVASCCGLEFDPALVGAAAGLGQIPALKRFGQIERKHRLIRSAGRHYVFDHHQIREALYTGLHDQLKEPYHVALAEALELRADARDKELADLDGALSAELARHFLDGARGDKALRYLDPALEHLEKCFLHEAAIRLADRALQTKDLLDGEERLRTLLRKASRHALRGERQAGRAALDEALDLADASGEPALRAKVRTRLGRHLESISDFEASLQMLEEAVDFALQAQDEQLEGNARGALGLVSLYRGQVDEARVHFEELLARARTVGNRRSEAAVTGNLMLVLRELGRIEEALRVGEESLALFQELEDRHGEARAAGNLGGVLERLGRADEARAHSLRCLALMRGIGDRRGEAIETVNLGSSLARLGRTEEALARFEQSLILMREIGDRRGEAHVMGWVGIVLGRLGRTDEARDQIMRHLSAARQIGDRRGEGHALMELATLLEGDEDLAWARRSCMDCLPLRRELGAKAAVAETLVVLGRLDAACGDTESAATRVDEALALARETKSPGTILAATVEQARLPGGDVEVALAALQEHEERVENSRMVEARFRLWELTQDKAHLTEAHRLLCCARDHAPEDCRDSMIENVPLHRDIMKAWKEHWEKQ